MTSNNNWRGSEDAILKTYNPNSGYADLEAPLQFYHWGAYGPDKKTFDGVDIRAEVLMLSSNVKVTSEDSGDGWGCAIVTSDFRESNGVWREGETFMDNVEVYNCSQYDTFRAALRFDGAKTKKSEVTNSAFHHGLGKGFQIYNSKNIKLKNNVFYDFIQFGGNI